MPHHNWSLRPGGMQGGMNFGARAWATHRQRSATVLLAWERSTLLAGKGSAATRPTAQRPRCSRRRALSAEGSHVVDGPRCLKRSPHQPAMRAPGDRTAALRWEEQPRSPLSPLTRAASSSAGSATSPRAVASVTFPERSPTEAAQAARRPPQGRGASAWCSDGSSFGARDGHDQARRSAVSSPVASVSFCASMTSSRPMSG